MEKEKIVELIYIYIYTYIYTHIYIYLSLCVYFILYMELYPLLYQKERNEKWWWIFQSVVYEGVNYSLLRKAWICNKLGLIFNILYTREDIRFLH